MSFNAIHEIKKSPDNLLVYNNYCKFGNFRENLILANNFKRHICHVKQLRLDNDLHISVFVCLFDLILYVHSTIFQLCGTVLPGLNQY